MFIIRFLFMVLLRPLFWISGMDFNLKEATFATAAGLRGSVSLILIQAVITELHATQSGPDTVPASPPLPLLHYPSHSYLPCWGKSLLAACGEMPPFLAP